MASSLSSPASGASLVATASNPIFLESARPAIVKALGEHLIPDLAKIIAGYAIQGKAFMAEDWKRYYNVEVEDLELGSEFYDWWFRPDAGDLTKLNCDTHFSPILCPETVLETAELPPPALRHRFASYVDRTDYSMDALDRLVRNPKEGYLSRLSGSFDEQIINAKAGPACYIVARKELFARNLSIPRQREYMEQVNAKTQAGYEVLPRALHLATAALVHHTVTGDRYLGDKTGIEKRLSFGVCEEIFKSRDRQYPVIVGGQELFAPEVVGEFRPYGGLTVTPSSAGLFCSIAFGEKSIGIVGLRKFLGYRKLNT